MPYEFTDQYTRNNNDFYTEPPWTVRSLLAAVPFEGTVHDPACGIGTIPTAFYDYPNPVTYSDLIARGFGPVKDFFADATVHDNIVTNPPYKLSEYFIHYGLKHIRYKFVILARLSFLESQRRFRLFTEKPPAQVIVLSRRPSMPPAGFNIEAKGGKTAFCWIIWDKTTSGPTILNWTL